MTSRTGQGEIALVVAVLLIIVILLAGGMWGCPQYNVYTNRLAGQAELERAEYNRRIVVQEAQAKKDAASMLGEAEVARAHGVAEANRIIGESLKNNEGYLRYLWIQNLEHAASGTSVIYVPTEAGLPILEATRLHQ